LAASLQSQQQQQQLMMGLNGLQVLLQQQNNAVSARQCSPQGLNLAGRIYVFFLFRMAGKNIFYSKFFFSK
jgi:hypothetical protein